MTNSTERAAKVKAEMAKTATIIIQSIEAGIADPTNWTAPWNRIDPALLVPTNPVTGNRYSAGNRLVLAIHGMLLNASPQWATYRQWASIDAQVRKGQHAVHLFRPQSIKYEDPDTGEDRFRIVGWSMYPVFHAGQVDGYDAPVEDDLPVPADMDQIDGAFDFVAAVGAELRESGDRAFYSPTTDHIGLPERQRFTDAEGAWSTALHELAHWTGHTDRLDRDLSTRFGDEAYAAEELVAEMSAAFSMAQLGRSSVPRADHANYLASWVQVLKSNPKALFQAASLAEKASAFVLDAHDRTLVSA